MTNAPNPAGRRHIWTRGDRLRAAREHMPGSPTQEQFARILPTSRSTVRRYEADVDGSDKPIVIKAWADATGYDYDWLMHGDGPFGTDGLPVDPFPAYPDAGGDQGAHVARCIHGPWRIEPTAPSVDEDEQAA